MMAAGAGWGAAAAAAAAGGEGGGGVGEEEEVEVGGEEGFAAGVSVGGSASAVHRRRSVGLGRC